MKAEILKRSTVSKAKKVVNCSRSIIMVTVDANDRKKHGLHTCFAIVLQ